MNEGRVFLCGWEAGRRGFRVWVRRRPRLTAFARTFDLADEKLGDVIAGQLGDGENARQYQPPPPPEPLPAPLTGRLIRIAGDGRALVVNPDELFEGGYCRLCHKPRGPRTAAPLVVRRIDSSSDVGRARTARFDFPALRYFSRAFLARLTPRERSSFVWRPVERAGRAGKPFFELVAARVMVPLMTLPGTDLGIKRCSSCGWSALPIYVLTDALPRWARAMRHPFTEYVDGAALPRRLPTSFAVGKAPLLSPVVTQERWRTMLGRAGTRGAVGVEIGIVARASRRSRG